VETKPNKIHLTLHEEKLAMSLRSAEHGKGVPLQCSVLENNKLGTEGESLLLENSGLTNKIKHSNILLTDPLK
jgi:hypothetical protein